MFLKFFFQNLFINSHPLEHRKPLFLVCGCKYRDLISNLQMFLTIFYYVKFTIINQQPAYQVIILLKYFNN